MKFLQTLTTAQKLGLTIALFGFLSGASTQLTDILAPFGSAAPLIVKEIVSLASFGSGILGIVLTFVTGQSSQLAAVQDMPGVEKIVVNTKANATLATMTVDPSNAKIEALPEAKAAVTAIAAAAQ